MDTSTRRLRSFIELAEQLHFGRTAQHLFVTQQALSKQIATLEAEVGIELVSRTTRSVELTPAGEQFLRSCRRAIRELDEGVAAIREDPGILRLGMVMLGALELTEPILSEFRASRPASEIITRQFTFADPSAGLADRSSDIAIVRVPIDIGGLNMHRLFVEPVVVAVSSAHAIASMESVSVDDLANERITMSNASGHRYRRFWTLAKYRSAPMPTPVLSRSHAEQMGLVASGRALSITSAASARLTPHPGVSFVRIREVAGTRCVIAWRGEEDSPLIRDFIAGAKRVVAHEKELIRFIENPTL